VLPGDVVEVAVEVKYESQFARKRQAGARN
jgi:hypothetical protein